MARAVTIPPIRAEDAPAGVAIVLGRNARTDWMPDGPDRTEPEPRFAEDLALREMCVAEDRSQLAGPLPHDPRTAYIFGFHVAEPGRVMGKALIDRVTSGRDRLRVRPPALNRAAHRSHLREGFAFTTSDLDGDDGVPERRIERRR